MTQSKKNSMSIRDIVAIALLAAFTAALGLIPAIPIAGLPVPLTAQTLGVLMSGALLGAKRGFLAVVVFWFLVAIGSPTLSGGHGGIGSFFTPATGYLLGWGAGAWVIGAIYEFFDQNLTSIKELFALILGGIIVIHGFGIIWLAWFINLTLPQALVADLVFVPGDFIKIIVVLGIIRAIRRGLPGAI